jgi:hypothetical protein
LSATRIVGYSTWTPDRIVDSACAGEPAESRPGDFTAIVEEEAHRSLQIVSAPIAAFPYYYAIDAAKRLHIGNDVFALAKSAGLSWEWNVRAIRCLALFGHTIGRHTLHPRVYRMPADTLMRADETGIAEKPLGFWDQAAQRSKADGPADVLSSLGEVLRRDTQAQDVLLSLSAGYDSRLLLALCLNQGIRPRTVTMGPTTGTDVGVAAELARMCGLRHERIELNATDYLTYGMAICRATSGVKTAGNWHTYLYARAAGSSEREVHVVGSNGEFARSFYLPGRSALTLGAVARASAISPYWLVRLERRRLRFRSWPLVYGGGLRESIDIAFHLDRAGGDLAAALDRFYATERVRHFIGNGLALYAAVGRPRAPFLEACVLTAIRGLRRDDRVRNRFHQSAIAKLAPALASVPFNTPLGSSRGIVGYSPFAAVRRLDRSAEIILDCPLLDGLIPKAERERLLRLGGDPEFELLLTLAFAGHCAGDP